jgi:hypothetical protein
MIPLIVTLLVLWSGWRAYRNARRDGTWSNKQFLVTLLGALGLCAVISFPMIFVSPSTMQAHQGLSIASILLAIAVGVTWLTIYANRWRKRELLKRSGQNRTLGVAIITFLLFAAGASAQTAYRDPGGSFTVEVPAGWQAQKNPESSQVTIRKGDASASFDVEPTEDGSTPPPREVLAGSEQQLQQECPQVEVLRRGDATLAGQPGLYLLVSCNDPQHGTAIMTVAVAAANGKVLICNTSAYSTQYSSVKPVLDGIVRSFRLGSGSAGMPRAGNSNQAPHREANPVSATDAQRLRALEDACSAGVLTPEECAEKRAALTRGGNSSDSSVSNPKLQALQRACEAGVFTPQECAAKRAALTGAASNPGQADDQAPPPPRSNGQNGGRQPDFSHSPRGNNGGDIYNDPQGVFTLMIPQGWTAKTNRGCYGPPENCPPNAAGVNITQGKSWAFVAPFSGKVNQLDKMVSNLALEIQSQYKDFSGEIDPAKLNGLDVAFGTFKGIDQDRVMVSLVIVGIAAPGGRYFVAESSVAKSELQTVGAELTSMLNSLRFAGQ